MEPGGGGIAWPSRGVGVGAGAAISSVGHPSARTSCCSNNTHSCKPGSAIPNLYVDLTTNLDLGWIAKQKWVTITAMSCLGLYGSPQVTSLTTTPGTLTQPFVAAVAQSL